VGDKVTKELGQAIKRSYAVVQPSGYMSLTHQQLIEELHRRDGIIAELRDVIAGHVRARVRDQKAQKLEQARLEKRKALAEKKQQKTDIEVLDGSVRTSQEFVGKSARSQFRYTPRGGFLLAARRSLANCAASGVGYLLMRDLCANTVNRWEIKLRAALNAASVQFFKDCAFEVMSHAMVAEPGWKFMINCYRSDATNSQVWNRCKLHVTEVHATYTSAAIEDHTEFAEILKGLRGRRILGDLQKLTGSTSEATLSCIRKQLSSVGALAITAADCEAAKDPGALPDFSDRAISSSSTVPSSSTTTAGPLLRLRPSCHMCHMRLPGLPARTHQVPLALSPLSPPRPLQVPKCNCVCCKLGLS